MNEFVLFFFIPLAWFVTVFMIEAGSIVMVPICKIEKYRKQMMLNLGVLWALIATSLVYLVVSLDTIFAPVMFVTGTVLIGPLLALIVFIGLHHFFIGTAEGSGSLGLHTEEKRYLILAMPAALIVAFLGTTLFTSVFSGFGFSFTLESLLKLQIQPNYVEMLFNPFNILFFLAVVFYVVYFTVAYYGIRERWYLGALGLTLAHALFLGTTAVWLPVVFQNAISNPGYWLYVILTYALLFVTTFMNVPWRQVWVVLLTFTGSMMFGAFTDGRILQYAVPAGTVPSIQGSLAGVPAEILLTNPTTLVAGTIVLGMAGILVIGGFTAVAYKALYKRLVERMEAAKVKA
ncbi:MAG: hypothetical protein ACP5HQ_07610 [Thermoprotei archaeon]